MGNKLSVAGKPTLTRAETLNLMKPVSERSGLEAAQKNRTLLAFELEVVSVKLDRFGWSGLSQAMKDRLTADWVDVLGAYDVREVKRAIADCLSSKPKMPTEYEVKSKVEAYRGDAVRRAVPDVSPEPEQPRVVDADMKARADAIVAGFNASGRSDLDDG